VRCGRVFSYRIPPEPTKKHNIFVVGLTKSLGLIAVVAATTTRNPYTINYARLASVQEASHPNGRGILCTSYNIVLSKYAVAFHAMELYSKNCHGFVILLHTIHSTRNAVQVRFPNIKNNSSTRYLLVLSGFL